MFLGHCEQCCNELWCACILFTMFFSLYMSRSWIAGSQERSFFRFLRKLYIFFIVALPVYTNSVRIPFSSHPLQHLLSVDVLIMAIWTCIRWYFIVLLICLSIIISDVRVFDIGVVVRREWIWCSISTLHLHVTCKFSECYLASISYRYLSFPCLSRGWGQQSTLFHQGSLDRITITVWDLTWLWEN